MLDLDYTVVFTEAPAKTDLHSRVVRILFPRTDLRNVVTQSDAIYYVLFRRIFLY
jgi:hypothetical protein